MRRQEFSDQSPGFLADVDDGVAFIPNPLPPDLALGHDVYRASEEARGALGEFVGESRRLSNLVLITRPLLNREAIDSNAIEGTYTQAREVLLQDAGVRARDPERTDDLHDVSQYRAALLSGETWLADGRPLNLAFLRGVHAELLSTGRGLDRHPGQFRATQALIGSHGDTIGTARFVPAPPEQLNGAMDALALFLQQDPAFSPIIACALVHYQFEAIHPFEDGNGRMGRLLIPLYLTAQGVIPRPNVYVSPYFESHRDDYYALLKRVSTHGAWKEWILFFLTAVRSQATEAKRRVEAVLDLDDTYRRTVRERTRPQAPLAAIEVLMQNVVVSVRQVQEHARCHYSTARAALDTLTTLRIVEPMEGTYPRLWFCRELFETLYE